MEEVAVSPVSLAGPDRGVLPVDRHAIHGDVHGTAADAALVGASRCRIRRELVVKDRRSGLLTGGSFLVVVAGWIALAPPRSVPIGMFAACVAAFIVAASVEF